MEDSLDKLLDYSIPKRLVSQCPVGQRVKVRRWPDELTARLYGGFGDPRLGGRSDDRNPWRRSQMTVAAPDALHDGASLPTSR